MEFLLNFMYAWSLRENLFFLVILKLKVAFNRKLKYFPIQKFAILDIFK